MSKKIIFMGTPEYATIIFEKLLKEDYEIVALFTQPDKKVGRKQIVTPPHIKQFVIDNGLSIPIYQPTTLKDEFIKNIIKKLCADFIIVAAYGQILPKDILDIAPCINLHASLLPLYRGASPIQQAILNGDKFTGVTAMMMDVGLDSGDILGFKYLKLDADMCVDEVFNKLSICAANLIIEVLQKYDLIKPKKQNLQQVSYCKKINKNDGLVRFNNAKKMYQKYKAYKFWPGIFLKSRLKIKELKLNEEKTTNNAGEIIAIKNNYIIVGCIKGSIKIFEVQAPSKKAMNVIEYIRGKRLKIGNTLT